MPEKREIRRHRKRLKVRYGDGRQKSIGFIEELSEDGFFIRTGLVFSPQSTLTIDLDTEGETISLSGRVQWTKRIPANMVHKLKGGMGIKIESFISGEDLYRKLIDILRVTR
jgi:PilZ domain